MQGQTDDLAAERAALGEVRDRVMNVIGHALLPRWRRSAGQVEVLSRTTDASQRDELIEALLRSSRRLERLLDDVLVASQIETRLPVGHREPVIVADAVRVVWASSDPTAPAAHR